MRNRCYALFYTAFFNAFLSGSVSEYISLSLWFLRQNVPTKWKTWWVCHDLKVDEVKKYIYITVFDMIVRIFNITTITIISVISVNTFHLMCYIVFFKQDLSNRLTLCAMNFFFVLLQHFNKQTMRQKFLNTHTPLN